MRIVYIIVLFISIIFIDCKKPVEVNYKIFGHVVNSQSNEAVSNSTVSLKAQILESGTFNNSYQSLETISTDANGYFEFNIKKEAFNSFRIEFDTELYFHQEEVFSPESIHPSDGIDISNEIDPIAYVNLRLRNTSPLDEEDQLSFRYVSAYFPECVCCDNDYKHFYGSDVDTLVSCAVVGDKQLDYTYSVVRAGVIINTQGGQYVESFETTDIEINY